MRNAREVHGPLVEEINDELATEWERMIEEAEHNIRDVRITMRWLNLSWTSSSAPPPNSASLTVPTSSKPRSDKPLPN